MTASNQREPIEVLGGDNTTNAKKDTPKIIYVKGATALNDEESDKPVTADHYADPEYGFQFCLVTYSPYNWG
ncbi:hypothetical protein [Domibacillus robiginosus]|uniref:hypothetical protein n=1 Tax=Domibacillus robiginosus TaxID=1071054 RepID=UPI00067DCBAB|nr:hypothetical protein [Domibacillus robiginosus]